MIVLVVVACAELVWLDVPVPPSDTQRVGEVADNMMGSEVVRCALVCGVEFVCRAGVDSGPKVVSGIVVGIGGFVRCVEVVCGAACAELLWLDMLVSPCRHTAKHAYHWCDGCRGCPWRRGCSLRPATIRADVPSVPAYDRTIRSGKRTAQPGKASGSTALLS